MGKSRSPRQTPAVRRFQRAAALRLEEGRFLLQHGYTTAAVYLAGYAVECALKALILSREPVARHATTLVFFRGTKAHEFRWLSEQLRRRNVVPSAPVAKLLARVAWWTTDLRYDLGEVEKATAEDFLNATELLLAWAKERF